MRPSRTAAADQVTLFALPKAFEGHFGVIQENAIRSWLGLPDVPRILLMGDDPGTAAVAARYGLAHCPAVARSPAGVPLLSSLFEQARAVTETPWLCYLNADIILLDDFSSSLERLAGALGGAGGDPFLVTAQRGHLDLDRPLDLTDPAVRQSLERQVARAAVWDHKGALDLFLYRRDLYRDLPPFAVGRGAWDPWLLWKAVDGGARVIDASPSLRLVHQLHDYGHSGGGWQGVWATDDAKENARLAAGRMLTLDQAASHSLTAAGLEPGIVLDRCRPGRLAAFQLSQGLRAAREGAGPRAQDLCWEALLRQGYFLPRDPAWRLEERAACRGLTGLAAGPQGAGESLFEAVQDVLGRPYLDRTRAMRASEEGRPLVVWGGGGGGRGLCRYLARHDLEVAGVVDSNPAKQGGDLLGHPVTAPESLRVERPEARKPFVLIASIYAGEIEAQLGDLGYHRGADYLR